MTCTIVKKKTKRGERRYVVRYRLGGRGHPLIYGGTFLREKEARVRKDWIVGEVAAGRNPQGSLQALLTPVAPIKVETLLDLGPRYLTSRVDLDAKTEKSHRSALERIYAWAGDRDPHTLTFQDCQVFVGVLSTGD